MPKTNKTSHRITEFRVLEDGWNFGEGVAPSDKVIAWALKVNDYAIDAGFKTTEAFPGTDGSIEVSAYYDNVVVDIRIEESGRADFWLDYDDDNMVFKVGLDLWRIQSLLAYWGRQCRSSDFSTMSITTAKSLEDSKVQHSPPQITVESPSSTEIVLIGTAKNYVNIFKSITESSLVSRLYSGSLSPKSSPKGTRFHTALPNQETTVMLKFVA